MKERDKLIDGSWMRLGAWDETASVRIAPFEDIELEVGRLFPPAPGDE